MRIAAGNALHLQRYRGIDEHAQRAERKADDERPETTLRIGTAPKHAKKEHHKDRRGKIALYRLQVAVQPVRAADHRDPGEAKNHTGDGCKPSRTHEFLL